MLQVMQCLIDLGALQPTGDLSSVRMLTTTCSSNILIRVLTLDFINDKFNF